MASENYDALKFSVDVWHLNIKNFIFDDVFKQYEYFLSADEIQKIHSFLLEKDRLLCLVSRVLLRWSLSWYYPRKHPAEWRFSTGKYGKPYLVADQLPDVEFNLTHSGDIVLCALTRAGAVGIDIETTRFMKDIDGVVERFFALEEKHFLSSLNNSDKAHAFFRLWTVKEAYVKAIGAGMQISFDSFAIQMENMTSRSIALCYEFDGVVREWQFFQEAYSNNLYPVSIAVMTSSQLGLVWRSSSFLKL